MTDIKIHDSKGKVFQTCPFLSEIMDICGNSVIEKMPLTVEECFIIDQHCESVRKIAKHLRGHIDYESLSEEEIIKPYNLMGLLKNLRIILKQVI